MKNMEKYKLRLYRAMKVYQSDELVSIEQDGSEPMISFLNMIDKIYSHIIPSLKSYNNSIIYSFTDDFSIAKSFLGERGYTNYNRIGYIDISVKKNMSPSAISTSLLFLQPLWRMEDWIDLAIAREYEHIKSSGKGRLGHSSVELCNLNYKRDNLNIINTLLPSRNGALSLASPAREYAVICKNLKVNIINDIDNYKYPLLDSTIEDAIPCLHNWIRLNYVNNYILRECAVKVCRLLRNDTNNKNINRLQKKWILDNLVKYDTWLKDL